MFDVSSLVHDLDMRVYYWARPYGRFEFVGGGSVPYLNPFEAVTAWAVLPHSIPDRLNGAANRKAYQAALNATFPHGISPWIPDLGGVAVPYLGEVPDSVVELALEAATNSDRVADFDTVPAAFTEMTGVEWPWWRAGGRDAFWEGFTSAAAECSAHPKRTSDFEVDRIAAWLGVDTSGIEAPVYTLNGSTDLLSLLTDDYPQRAHAKAGRNAWDRWMTEYLDPSSHVAW
jgi:hypothetical protein